MGKKRVLKATDKRRLISAKGDHTPDADDSNGAGRTQALFNDRRKPNGRGKRASG